MHVTEIYDADNRWRDRHPAEKATLAAGMLLLSVALPAGLVTALIGVLMAAAALVGARVSWRRFLGGLAVPAGFLVVGTVTILVSLAREPGHAWPTVTLDGTAAGRVLLRGLTATTCLIFLATTTSLSDVLALLQAARCPPFAVELMMLTYRFALALVQTAQAVRLAQSLRLGYGSRIAGYRALALLASNLLPRSLSRAQRLMQGLETRGYDGQLPVLCPSRRLSWGIMGSIVGLELTLIGMAVISVRGGL
jgi:cobalt/nickel transport system permease protein